MVVGSLSRGCQVAVIGGGPGGYAAAIRLAQAGKDVILIERAPTLGGICLNEGCIPSKALIHAANLLDEIRSASAMGIDVAGESLEVGRLITWKDAIVRKLTGGVAFLLKKNGVDVIRGSARFDDARTLTVETESGIGKVEFEKAVIATGSSPTPLSLLPVDGEKIIGARQALSPGEIPERLLVVGAGYIGLELGSLYARMGSKVTIVDLNPKLVPALDDEVARALRGRLEELGVRLLLGTKVTAYRDGSPLAIDVTSKGGKTLTLEGEKILVSIGRVPNTKGIGLEEMGVDLDGRGFIRVNERMESSIPGIYAIGDVAGGALLAHKAYREAKVVSAVIAGQADAMENVIIPAVIYTDPEIAWAGLSEKGAREMGHEVITGLFPFSALGRAMTLNTPDGFVKTVADAATQRILGITIVGAGASEMIAEGVLAIEMGAFLDDIEQTVHPHPTLSEGLLESVEAALGKAIHRVNR